MRTAAFLLFLVLPLAVRANPAPAENTFAPIKAQIDALLEHRRQPPPFSPATENPFQAPGAAGIDAQSISSPVVPTAPRVAPAADLIHRIASQLKISGTVSLGGRQQIIINSVACEEGRILPVRESDRLYRVRIKHITPTTVTIEIGESELTMPLR
ncbi:MAG: hypothetical protein ACHQ5A_13955 [Opitutales bacterium]